MGLLILFLMLLAGCTREFESPYLPSSPEYAGSAWSHDSNGNGVADSVEKYAPGCQGDPEACLTLARQESEGDMPVDPIKPGKTVLIESISAPDMNMIVGETRPAQVSLQPADVSSRIYELSSQNGSVAVVRPSGIFATGEGTTLITVHALDGSDKLAQFRVRVSLQVAGKGKGKHDDDG